MGGRDCSIHSCSTSYLDISPIIRETVLFDLVQRVLAYTIGKETVLSDVVRYVHFFNVLINVTTACFHRLPRLACQVSNLLPALTNTLLYFFEAFLPEVPPVGVQSISALPERAISSGVIANQNLGPAGINKRRTSSVQDRCCCWDPDI